jgi:hypothetical protein
VHVVSKNADLLRRFEALGFRPGLEPQRPVLGGMHELTQILLDAFDARLPTASLATRRTGPAP